ncbi:LptE family protein [Flavobacteriaceae bacterium 3-367]|uniref:LptE family protein n=1 Tax=Eudoraea algarum TaxID=3417568 RepID=UPI003290EF21
MDMARKIILLLVVTITVPSCAVKTKYNLTGLSGEAKTFQVNYFQNKSSQNPGSTFDPGLDRDFTLALQDLIVNQTGLNLTRSRGDLLYEGEIIEYRVSPTTASANQRAAQNRLTISVQVRFLNNMLERSNFEKRFSHFYDYDANSQLASVKNEAHKAIFERLTQDIFNESLTNW